MTTIIEANVGWAAVKGIPPIDTPPSPRATLHERTSVHTRLSTQHDPIQNDNTHHRSLLLLSLSSPEAHP